MPLKNVAAHFLVPRHEIVPPEKLEEVLRKFGSSAERLPRILSTDPVAEECGAKKGDIIKITRQSPTAGMAVYFRLVV